jgi:hypothetical protein
MAGAEQTPEATPGDPDTGYSEELNLKHLRFLALGGGSDIQMDMKAWTPLSELITPLHRKIVFDLAASGISNQDVADVVGISKERLQTLFEQELKSAYQLCHASLARSLYFQGISGDGKAAEVWLKLHNRSKWATKTQVSGTEEGAPIKTEDQGAKSLLNELLSGMLTSKKLKGAEKPAPKQLEKTDAKMLEAPAPRKSSKPKVIKKVRQES